IAGSNDDQVHVTAPPPSSQLICLCPCVSAKGWMDILRQSSRLQKRRLTPTEAHDSQTVPMVP
nr:hypothetical protein [Gammaproteobacteria bacterium]